MKKILIICFVFFMFLNVSIVKADDDPCGCNQYTPGTAAHFHCIDNCQVSADQGDDLGTGSGNTYAKIVCGDTDVPYIAAQVTTTVINILKIVTPIIIIIFGMIDLIKAVVAQKDDDIAKGRKNLFKRILIGAFVFLVFVFVEVIIGLVAPKNENANMWNCVDCFVNGNCSSIMK